MSRKPGKAAAPRDLRRDVALANRIIERFGLSNAFGHASARIPGTNTFCFPTRRSPGLADEKRLLVLDTDGLCVRQEIEGAGADGVLFLDRIASLKTGLFRRKNYR